MHDLIVFDEGLHRSTFVDLCEEYFNWMMNELQKNYDFDGFSMIGTTLKDYIENNVDEFTSSIASDGVLYLLQVKGEIVGMGALRRLREEIGEIKRQKFNSSRL